MTPTSFEILSKRALACRGWKWLPGMSVVCPPKHYGSTGFFVRVDRDEWIASDTDMPNFYDGCTLGGMLSLVRQAWQDGIAHVSPVTTTGTTWCVTVKIPTGHKWFYGNTEAEALICALEGADENGKASE